MDCVVWVAFVILVLKYVLTFKSLKLSHLATQIWNFVKAEF